MPTSLAWPNVRVSRSKFRSLLSFVLLGGCATSPPPAATPELELEPATTANEQHEPAGGETSNPTPPELRPCSEANPGGCTAPKPQRARLDSTKRYSVAVRVDDPSQGPPEAPVTLVVFSDFQCPFCSRLEPVLVELRSRYPKELRVVWKDLPLSIHRYAMPAALLAREAYVRHGNERFWHVHEELFLHQSEFSEAWLSDFAASEQLTWPPSETYLPRVEQSVQQADELSIAATPTAFVNGRPVVGAEHISVYADLINEELGK